MKLRIALIASMVGAAALVVAVVCAQQGPPQAYPFRLPRKPCKRAC